MIRSRKIALVCYLDKDAMEKAVQDAGADAYAYILHDMDTDINGELKKPHYHVYLEYEHEHQFNVVAEKFNIAENNVEKVKSTKGVIRYLVHADSPDKYQYSLDNVVSCNIDIEKFFTERSEALKAIRLTNLVVSYANVPLPSLVRLIAESGLYDVFRRNSSVYILMWKECRHDGRGCDNSSGKAGAD